MDRYIVISTIAMMFSIAAHASSKTSMLEFSKLAPNLYLHTSYKLINNELLSANGAVFIDSNSAAYLIDTPWNESDMPALFSWLKKKKLTLKAAIVTHFHEDRTAGLGYLNGRGVDTYAFIKTNAQLREQGKPTANHSFKTNVFRLANNKIEILFPGGGHAADNVVVYLSTVKALVAGCIIRSIENKNLGWTGNALFKNWYQSVTNIDHRYEIINIVIPGHGITGDRSLINHTLKLSKDIQF
ncbi:subclass B1 metallo-beta-lactamase [Endozoicomonas sp. SM1973]|uniref:beta-lactamase n=1 Tax=Spartinivicinus marinus TaxID=2994442 RepID=A0A853IDQ3_9GAMM|nr:subclass B1 metallo-beta-lactamase [Spartinivicinus marinus]MCX4027571.1 subclass B1 metallo-beta-lactamase [Spartinivicinus marinus]NYZ68184.1 subclass B1 metallo-beta-lactamase [Spartinivicinus marinus]